MKLIVGLGNPGTEYAWTRHNIGWLILDSFVNRFSLAEPQMKYKGAFWGPLILEGERVSFLKPYTYMNLSGSSVLQAVRYQNLEPKDILVIYDDAALPWGKVRLKGKGSAGGQKGMTSILGALQTHEVPRLRIGVGVPSVNIDLADWVLSKIPQQQRKQWDNLTDIAYDAIKLWLTNDLDKAMSEINGLKFDKKEKA
ncbi:MAG: aminoacyl-tRNA hydrolase [Synergistaceae bacterium]|nr:aminoacyl-tRNA hydrolase [Synergistaceae bacterium]